jgi:hypothetical protein
MLEHDPKKREPVFRADDAQIMDTGAQNRQGNVKGTKP